MSGGAEGVGPAPVSNEAESGWREATPYAVMLVVYVVLGLTLKVVVLNWVVGPLFLLFALYVIPRTWQRLTGRGADRGGEPA